eukprot:gene13639-biopygen12112
MRAGSREGRRGEAVGGGAGPRLQLPQAALRAGSLWPLEPFQASARCASCLPATQPPRRADEDDLSLCVGKGGFCAEENEAYLRDYKAESGRFRVVAQFHIWLVTVQRPLRGRGGGDPAQSAMTTQAAVAASGVDVLSGRSRAMNMAWPVPTTGLAGTCDPKAWRGKSPQVNEALAWILVIPTLTLWRDCLAGWETDSSYTHFWADRTCAEVAWQVPWLGLARTCDAQRWRGKSRGLALDEGVVLCLRRAPGRAAPGQRRCGAGAAGACCSMPGGGRDGCSARNPRSCHPLRPVPASAGHASVAVLTIGEDPIELRESAGHPFYGRTPYASQPSRLRRPPRRRAGDGAVRGARGEAAAEAWPMDPAGVAAALLQGTFERRPREKGREGISRRSSVPPRQRAPPHRGHGAPPDRRPARDTRRATLRPPGAGKGPLGKSQIAHVYYAS